MGERQCGRNQRNRGRSKRCETRAARLRFASPSFIFRHGRQACHNICFAAGHWASIMFASSRDLVLQPPQATRCKHAKFETSSWPWRTSDNKVLPKRAVSHNA
jgi:hypothetical protein